LTAPSPALYNHRISRQPIEEVSMRSSRTRRSRHALVALTCCVCGLSAAGCITRHAEPWPETSTPYQTPYDVDNALAISNDSNWRQFWWDLGRFGLVDRPSRLSPISVPY